MYNILGSDFFTQPNSLEIHPGCCMYQYFVLFYCYYSMVWMYHSLFSHSPTEGHLGCFHCWAIKKKAAMNICVQLFFVNIRFNFSGINAPSTIVGLQTSFFFVFVFVLFEKLPIWFQEWL